MANIEERLIELINLASCEVDGDKKVEYLYQIKELVLNHGLINNFFQDIIAFQNDRALNVKKFVLAFIEAAFKHDFQLCPKSILSLTSLLNDTNNEIIKRSIQAATHFHKALVQWIVYVTNSSSSPKELASTVAPSSQSSATSNVTIANTNVSVKIEPGLKADSDTAIPSYDEIERTWLMWLQVVTYICNLLETSNNDGIRTQCIKFIETIVLVQTPRDKHTDPAYESNLIDSKITAPIKLSDGAATCGIIGIPKSGVLFNEEHKLELVEAAKRLFEQLVLFYGTSHISSVNLMATMQSLVVLAKQRYRLFMGRVIQAMESLNNRLPPTLTESQVQSVRKSLKLQLTIMLKHPYSLERYQHQITQLLQAVGSRQQEIHKVINEFKSKFGTDTQQGLSNDHQEIQKRIKLEPGPTKQEQGKINSSQSGPVGSQTNPLGKAKHLDLNKLTQELDEKEKRQIVVDSVKRILGDEKCNFIPPAQMEIKKKVLSTLANEFNKTECPKIIQDYIFSDLKNRHEICYAIIRKNYDVAAAKAAKRQINILDNQDLLKNYFDCFNSYLNRAMDLKDTKEREIILPKLYALREEYYSLTNQDQDEETVDK